MFTPLKEKIAPQLLTAYYCLVDGYVFNKAFQVLQLSVLLRCSLVLMMQLWLCVRCYEAIIVEPDSDLILLPPRGRWGLVNPFPYNHQLYKSLREGWVFMSTSSQKLLTVHEDSVRGRTL